MSWTVVAVATLAIVASAPWAAAQAPPFQRQVTSDVRVLEAALSPDGETIAYVTVGSTAGTPRLVVQPLAGRVAPREVASFPGMRAVAWSRDGSKFLFVARDSSGWGVFLVPLNGGPVRSVGKRPWAGAFPWAALSPDGDQVALCDMVDKQIQVIALASGDVRSVPLTGDVGMIHGLDWAPRGDWIVLRVIPDKGTEFLRVVNVATHQQRDLGQSGRVGPRWAPSGDAVYLVRAQGALWKIPFALEAKRDPGPARVVYRGIGETDVGLQHSGFSVSADGKRLLYVRLSRRDAWLVENFDPDVK